MNKRYISHTNFKKELLQNEDVLKKYNELNEEYQLIEEMLKARKRTGMSQAVIAEKMKTTPSAISRLESLNMAQRPSPSVDTLKKYAHALGCRLSIRLIPEEGTAKRTAQ